jgi:hypothetical protein
MYSQNIIEFTPEAVKAYLDKCILHWMEQKSKHVEIDSKSLYYIDAFQSVRVSLFGDLLSKEDLNDNNSKS